jgi:uncharacterized protein (TIGR03118 family)
MSHTLQRCAILSDIAGHGERKWRLKNLVTLLASTLIVLTGAEAQTNSYTVSNRVTSTQDSRLVNPWGLSRPISAHAQENEWWIGDQATGLSTLYDANGSTVDLAVTIPSANGSGTGSPTGTVYNSASKTFAFATLDGTISVWNATATPGLRGPSCAFCHVTSAAIKVNHSLSGASYQGLTIAQSAITGALAYFAANANGAVEVYDAQSFDPVPLPQGAFVDTKVPASYTSAGIQAIGSTIWVTYNASAGGGTGYVDAYDTAGTLKLRLERGFFNQPWGVALTPASFGKFSNMILLGNTGNGLIGAYNLLGIFQGYLDDGSTALVIPGLWGIEFGNGNTESGPTNVLYFNAGGVNQTTGVFGAITAN